MTRAISLLILLPTLGSMQTNAQPEDLVSVAVPAARLEEGNTTKVRISVMVREGYHIQANVVDDEALIPTALFVDGGEQVIVVRDRFPRAKKLKLEGTDIFLNVYGGEFPVRVYLTPSKGAQAGRYDLVARLQYQACDSRTCFFPRVLEFSVPVEILK